MATRMTIMYISVLFEFDVELFVLAGSVGLEVSVGVEVLGFVLGG